MDSISRALEITRSKRRLAGAGVRMPADPQFVYTQTRQIKVAEEVLRHNRIITGIQDRRIVDAYKLLRTRVVNRMQQNNWKTLGITSTGEHEGKTLTAVNLGISIAMKLNYTVLLVDTDLRRPNINSLFGIKPEIGINDYLNSNVPIEEILINPLIDRFVILPCSKPVENPSEILGSPKMTHLVGELKSRYSSRIILFDLPPILVGDDVMAFSQNLDALILVVEDNKTNSDDLRKALSRVEDIEIIGAVLNKSSEATKEYDYYYS